MKFMSKTKVHTHLKRYDRQVFPERLDELNRVYDRFGGNGITLEQLGKKIVGYQAKDMPTTGDGYRWFWGLHFRTGDGRTATLFPWTQDWSKQDGIQLDRSIAVYTRGEVDTLEIEGLVENLYQGFLELEREKRELQEASRLE